MHVWCINRIFKNTNLVIIQVVGQAADEELVSRVGNHCRHYTWRTHEEDSKRHKRAIHREQAPVNNVLLITHELCHKYLGLKTINWLCTRHIDTGVLAHAGQRLVIVGTTNLQTLALKDYTIKGHCLCGFVHWTELQRQIRGLKSKNCSTHSGRTRDKLKRVALVSPQGRQNSYPGWSVLQAQGFQGPEWDHPDASGHWRSPSLTPAQKGGGVKEHSYI